MKINSDSLQSQLTKNIRPFYLLAGAEPLLIDESRKLIRTTLLKTNFYEKTFLWPQTTSEWDVFFSETLPSSSLFAPHRYFEIFIDKGKLSTKIAEQLLGYLIKPIPNTIITFWTLKLDASSLKTAWYKYFEKNYCVVQHWPLKNNQLPSWIANRFILFGMKVSEDCCQTLADLTEGNLLAAQQEIEKLHHLYGTSPITHEQLVDACSNHARYDVFQFSDCLIQDDQPRTIRLFEKLFESGTAISLLLWALTREIRLLASLSYKIERHEDTTQTFLTNRILPARQSLYLKACKRKSANQWLHLVCLAAETHIKTRESSEQMQRLDCLTLLRLLR